MGRKGEKMSDMMAACGVMCSDCPAYHGRVKGIEYQRQTVEAWKRIYALTERAENISCGGCLGSDADLFHTSVGCSASRCCLSHAFKSCAECPMESCTDLEKAQAVWDGVPEIGARLSPVDFDTYARAYCGHSERLTAIRAARSGGK